MRLSSNPAKKSPHNINHDISATTIGLTAVRFSVRRQVWEEARPHETALHARILWVASRSPFPAQRCSWCRWGWGGGRSQDAKLRGQRARHLPSKVRRRLTGQRGHRARWEWARGLETKDEAPRCRRGRIVPDRLLFVSPDFRCRHYCVREGWQALIQEAPRLPPWSVLLLWIVVEFYCGPLD